MYVGDLYFVRNVRDLKACLYIIYLDKEENQSDIRIYHLTNRLPEK